MSKGKDLINFVLITDYFSSLDCFFHFVEILSTREPCSTSGSFCSQGLTKVLTQATGHRLCIKYLNNIAVFHQVSTYTFASYKLNVYESF